MKGILTFDLDNPDDARKHHLASKADELALAIWDYDQQLRSWLKYGHDDFADNEALEKAREALHAELEDCGLCMDDLG